MTCECCFSVTSLISLAVAVPLLSHYMFYVQTQMSGDVVYCKVAALFITINYEKAT